MRFPKKYCYNDLDSNEMKKVELKISKKSSVLRMSRCSKEVESSCGILYRHP